jgi:hypothetical protein
VIDKSAAEENEVLAKFCPDSKRPPRRHQSLAHRDPTSKHSTNDASPVIQESGLQDPPDHEMA